MQFDRPGSLDQARTVSIERGTNLGAIADQLQKEGAISSKWLFIAGVWMNKQQSALKAGEYLIPAHASMRTVMDVIASGAGVPYKITIPEGLTTEQIIGQIKAECGSRRRRRRAAARREPASQHLPVQPRLHARRADHAACGASATRCSTSSGASVLPTCR